MPRLIDADTFRGEVQEYVLPITTNNLMGAADTYHRIMHLLDDAPTIEAEPVKHGWWVHDINNLYGCSECMKRETMSHKKLKNYCPNCGAAMNEKKK